MGDLKDLKDAETKLLLTANDGSTVTIHFVGEPSAIGAIVNYVTNTANQPKKYGNHIYVWQTTSNIVPWAKSPDGFTAIDTDSSTSTQPVDFPFEDKGYILGYAVAATPNAVCSTIYVPQGSLDNPQAWQYANNSVKTLYVGTNLVQARYQVLQSYDAVANKNWLGLWQGSTVPYSGDPLKKVSVTQGGDSGTVNFTGVKLTINTTYSIGYFMVDQVSGRTSLAATSTFTVGKA
ncbi:hypothetical protein [Chromobacterium haemolyticum]|uniref:hypothetical protein n=1 Tax=Chromobacterium haemolyticum TaxID=394935 RepID=UPI000D312CBF|nr:hypothetical protein [Chromobacterium haemolyticum]PTU69521.1 hypothetical protein DBB33_08790 [Chromobacterium haemolyticum]